ncbi:hypothetical protein BH10PLA1_BH10PLA1_18750 [soil metagenome]
MSNSNPQPNARQQVAALAEEFKRLEAAGASKYGHRDRNRRNEVLDELQDAVGLNGKMVMERDILKRAQEIVDGK